MEKAEFLKTLPTVNQLYVLVNNLTKMPHVHCEQETFDDVVTMYEKKEDVEAAAKQLIQENIPCGILVIVQKTMGAFYLDLMLMGANRVDFVMEDGTHAIELGDIIRRKDDDEIPEGKRPIENPELKLSMMYFFQEMRKDIPAEEKKNTAKLEEEMIINIMRATYIMPIMEVERENGEKAQTFLQLKNPEGDNYIAAFTDTVEYNRFVKDGQRMPIVPATFEKLLDLRSTSAKGIVINPAGINVVLTNENLTKFEEAFELPS